MKTNEHTIKIQVPEGYRPGNVTDCTTVSAFNSGVKVFQVQMVPTPPPIDTNDIEYKLSVMRQGLLGRTIQYYYGDEWYNAHHPSWDWGAYTYRVKPTVIDSLGRWCYTDGNRIVFVPTVPSPRN